MSRTTRIFGWVATVLVFPVALAALAYLLMGAELARQIMPGHVDFRPSVLVTHATLASVALICGIVQLNLASRKNRWFHRSIGYAYALSVLFGGIAGLILAVNAGGGIVAQLGFSGLALAWIATTANAVRLVLQGDYRRHRVWMLRSFALTFAAVTLRLQLPFLIGMGGYSYAEASNFVAWSCWLPNILVMEWWLRRR
jgi:uncharacterized membrane protein YozB (DUF420 family)